MARKIGQWSNRILIVDDFIRRKRLAKARAYASKVLKLPEASEMLTKSEIEYLRLVISLESLEQFIKDKDNDRTDNE